MQLASEFRRAKYMVPFIKYLKPNVYFRNLWGRQDKRVLIIWKLAEIDNEVNNYKVHKDIGDLVNWAEKGTQLTERYWVMCNRQILECICPWMIKDGY